MWQNIHQANRHQLIRTIYEALYGGFTLEVVHRVRGILPVGIADANKGSITDGRIMDPSLYYGVHPWTDEAM